MKKIGLIGGIGPESTLDYYKRIVDAFRASTTEPDYPEIVIYSANLTELMAILKIGDMAELSDWLVEKIQVLGRPEPILRPSARTHRTSFSMTLQRSHPSRWSASSKRRAKRPPAWA
jgi:hypothetical protein